MKIERTITLLVAGLLVFLFGSCEKEIYSSGLVTEDFPMYVTASGSVVSTGQPVAIDYAASAAGSVYDNIGAIGTASAGALGNTLILGLFQTSNESLEVHDPVFTLQFWPDDLPAGRAPETEELEAIFVPGRIFTFGEGGDSVKMDIALVPGAPLPGMSSTAYAAMREGMLTVTEVFSYESGIPGLEADERSYRLVRFIFTGTIGVFNVNDFAAAEAAGEAYEAKESATLTGEGSLVLEAVWR